MYIIYLNKLFRHLVLVGLILLLPLLPGCEEDFLEENPQSSISESIFWETRKDAMRALVGCYEQYGGWHNNTDGWNAGMVEAMAFYSDIAQCKNPSAPGEFGAEMNSTSPQPYFMWNLNYRGIGRVNYFLENIGKVDDIDEDEKAEMTAEAKFIRAYRYFWLCQLFGDVPLTTKTLTFDEANSVSRDPKDQVVEFVLDELTAAAQDLPVSRPASEKGRIEKGAALAMKGRLLMAEERWSEAAETYENIIDLGRYIIDPRYKKLFEDEGENSDEIVLSLGLEEGTEISEYKTQRQMPGHQVGGHHHAAVFKNFVDAFLMEDGRTIETSPLYDPDNIYENRDPRLYAILFLPGYTELPDGQIYHGHPDSLAQYGFKNIGLTGYSLRKHFDAGYDGDKEKYGGDIYLIRYAEVLLSYLESKLEAGDNITQTLLDNTINKVREREAVDMPSVTETNRDELREIIRRERLVEFAFEGLRYWDLLRWGTAVEELNGKFKGMKLTDNPENYTGAYSIDDEGYLISIEREFEEHNYLFPIPESELEVNPNMEQNPGYD